MGVTKLSKGTDKPTPQRSLAGILLLTLSLAGLGGCRLFHNPHADLPLPTTPGDQPDKVLFQKAVQEINRGRYDVGRLTLQTLINTYPDSEYLSKAKLAIADSYYKEGGVSGLTQAEAEYKDFITFFPTAPEAPEAQFRAGMAHFRLLGKPDRDRTELRLAEIEFKEFLLKYPDSPLMPRVKARLRQVQEILAQSDYKIARFYYMKRADLAARSRFQEIADQYPNFSQGDKALWYLGQSLERLKQPQAAGPYYARILTEHPLSPLVDDAKERLTAMHQPIPRPTRAMLARAQADAAPRPRRDVFQKLGGMMSSSPDTSATRHGPVRLGGPKPAEVAVSKAPEGTTASAAIVVQPVGDASLSSGQAVNPKPADTGTAGESTASQESNGKPAQAREGPTASTADQPSATSSTSKKKGRLHLLKRIIKPF